MLKIFATYVPGMSISELNSLIEKGMSGTRFIYKETDANSFMKRVKTYEQLFNTSSDNTFIIMIDLPGTKPRIGYLGAPITLKKGRLLNFSISRSSEGIQIINLDKDKFIKIKVGDRILIADDSIELKVTKRDYDYIQCESVSSNGILKSGRSMVFPDSGIINLALSGQDKRFLQSSELHKLNFKIAVSFCHSPKIIQALTEKYKLIPQNIIPKIETVISKETLTSIIKNCEYAILGRGDLSVVHNGQEWFPFQLEFIKICKENSVNPIIGTGLFSSLSQSNRPKISEVSDVGFLLNLGVECFLIADDVSFTNPTQVLEQINDLSNSFVK